MRKHKATIEQIAARQAKRARMRELAKKVAAMSDVDRLELSSRYPIATIEGRALSLHNQLLLVMQANGTTPTLVGGFRQWLKAGRVVRKGEHGLSIWIPLGSKDSEGEIEADSDVRFICGTVFDVTQTEEIEVGTAVCGPEIADAFGLRNMPNTIVDEEPAEARAFALETEDA